MINSISWRPGIHDPSPIAWAIFSCYVFAALIAAWVGWKAPFDMPAEAKKAFLWRTVGFIMLLMAVNKQLDFQSLATDIGRAVARWGGWYGSRRTFQKVFVLSFGIGAFGIFSLSLRYLRDMVKEYYLLVVGFCILGTFIVVRAAMFQHVHIDPPVTIPKVRLRWLFEMAGCICIASRGIMETVKRSGGSRRRKE